MKEFGEVCPANWQPGERTMIPDPMGSKDFFQSAYIMHVCCTYCTVLYCTVLYCTVLYCTVLYCTIVYCTVLYCTIVYCTVLYCTVLLYTMLSLVLPELVSYITQLISSYNLHYHSLHHILTIKYHCTRY